MINITFTGPTGQISQTGWNKRENGAVTLKFYVNNSLGFETSAENIVIKDVVKQPSPEILGYDVYILLEVVGVIAFILIRKRNKS